MTAQLLIHDERRHPTTTDSRWQAAATGVSQPFYRIQPTRWQRLLMVLRPPVVLAVAALLAALGLLAVFQHVVAGVVSQGVVARMAAQPPLLQARLGAGTHRMNSR